MIAAALVAGAAALTTRTGRPRRVALGSVGFAIIGFAVGLTFTLRGAAAASAANRLTLPPLLLLTLVQLLRDRQR